MKNISSKITVLLNALTFAVAGATQAESLYVAPNTCAPNFVVPGNYYWGSDYPNFSQHIGVVSGNAWVETSWGAQRPIHTTNAAYSFNGSAPVAVNQQLVWDQVNEGLSTGSWSGFGGPGAGVYQLTNRSMLTGKGVSSISETRVTPLTGTLVKYSDQTALNPTWFSPGTGAVGVSNPGGDGYRHATGVECQYFYYAPGLTGTFDLEVSWGIGNTAAPSNANWYLDLNGAGKVADYVPLLTGINTGLFSDGVDRTTGISGGTSWGQWSGFKLAGRVTLNSNSRIVYENPGSAKLYGCVSDIQLTPVLPQGK